MWRPSSTYLLVFVLTACDADERVKKVAVGDSQVPTSASQAATADTAWQGQLTALSVVDTISSLVRLVPREEIPSVRAHYPSHLQFHHVAVDSAVQLRQLLRHLEVDSAPWDNVSAASIPTDLGTLPVAEKKSLFFRTLLPIACFHNRVLAMQRQRLQELHPRPSQEWNRGERAFVQEMSQYYRLENYPGTLAASGDTLALLLLRTDAIPASLVLAQAAIESGWGSSRFARQGNNLYGQRVWGKQASGLAPQGVEKARFRLAVFPTIGASLGSYMRNLNTHPAYEDFRRARHGLRQDKKLLEGHLLAHSLQRYSTRGQDYVDDVLRLMRQNDLQTFDALKANHQR